MELRGHFHILGIWPWVELVVELVVELKVKYPKYGNVLVPLQTILVYLQLYPPKGRWIVDKPKFVAFLVFFGRLSFIYRTNLVFQKCLETRRHLGSGRKTIQIAKDIPSLRANITIHWFGKY